MAKMMKPMESKKTGTKKSMGMKTPMPMVPKGKLTSDKVKGGKGNAAKKFA